MKEYGIHRIYYMPSQFMYQITNKSMVKSTRGKNKRQLIGNKDFIQYYNNSFTTSEQRRGSMKINAHYIQKINNLELESLVMHH